MVSVEQHCGTSAGYSDTESSSKAHSPTLTENQPKGGRLQPHLREKDRGSGIAKLCTSIRQSITASVLK